MQYTPSKERYTTMEYRHCGDSGLQLPLVSLGLWHNFGTNQDYENMRQMCFTSFDLGITHFDIANNYGPEIGSAEENFGKILREDFKGYRDELIISTKAGYRMWEGPYGDGGSRKYLISSLDQSLSRLKMDYVDIFYHHRMDPTTPIEETMGALNDIVKQGKALYVGLSNYDGAHMIEAMDILDRLHCPFVINQNRYNILDRAIENNGLKQAVTEKKKGLIIFSALAQGMLTDRYFKGIPEDSRIRTDGRFLNESSLTQDKMEKILKLNEIAKDRGQTLAQMALSWLFKDDSVTSVVIGASKPQQIVENVKILNHCHFTAEELAEIDRVSK